MARWGKPFVLLTGMAVMFAATALVPVVPGFALVIVCVIIAGFLTMVLFPAIMGSVPDIVARPGELASRDEHHERLTPGARRGGEHVDKFTVGLGV